MSKVALIIGASSGIGEAIALKLLKDGYTVYNGSRSPAHHERIINITVDVANEEAIRGLADCLGSRTPNRCPYLFRRFQHVCSS